MGREEQSLIVANQTLMVNDDTPLISHFGVLTPKCEKELKEMVQTSIIGFLEKTLQLDSESLKIERKAEKFLAVN